MSFTLSKSKQVTLAIITTIVCLSACNKYGRAPQNPNSIPRVLQGSAQQQNNQSEKEQLKDHQ